MRTFLALFLSCLAVGAQTTNWVGPGGTDSGSSSTYASPFATIAYGITHTTGGNWLMIKTGTYVNTTDLNPTANFGATPLNIGGETGSPGDVIITGSGTVDTVKQQGIGYRWNCVQFQTANDSVESAFRFYQCTNIGINNCNFLVTNSSGHAPYCVNITGGVGINNCFINNSRGWQTNQYKTDGLHFGSTPNCWSLGFTNDVFIVGGSAINLLQDATNIYFSGGSYIGTNTSTGSIVLTAPTNFFFYGVTAISSNSASALSMLDGGGKEPFSNVISGCFITSSIAAINLRSNNFTVISNSIIESATGNAIALSGCTSCVVDGSVIHSLAANGIYGNYIPGLIVHSNTIRSATPGMALNYTFGTTANNVDISQNDVIATNSYGLQIGQDTQWELNPVGVDSGNVYNNTVNCINAHGLFIGAGCSNMNVFCNVCQGADFSAVCKECQSITWKGNIFLPAGAATGLLFKGGKNNTASRNFAYTSGNPAFRMQVGDSGNYTTNITVTQNWIRVLAAGGPAYQWNAALASQDAGGTSYDRNRYSVGGTAPYAVINVTSLVKPWQLRTNWVSYGSPNNDENSTFLTP